jgi:myo-inositol-1(or 4)-monophosphatase
VALKFFRSPIQVSDKAGPDAFFDPVTRADKETESCIRRAIEDRWPTHGIIGEEHDNKPARSDYSWIIDPIDGTRAYISGNLGWGILLGLTEKQAPILGLMHQPYTREVFTGDNHRAWMTRDGQRQPLQVSGVRTLEDAILYTTTPDMFTDPILLRRYNQLGRQVKLQRFGGDCYAYCLLAMGFVDLVVESSLQSYDIVPLIPVIQGAGGVVTDIEGQCPMQGGTVIAAATPELHAAALVRMQSI